MKKILLSAAITVVALSSCSKNEVLQNQAENNAVTFGLYSSDATKATETTNTSIQTSGFGVYGYFQDNADWATTNHPNFMYNQKVNYDAGSWSYTPVKYWSNDATDKYSFFAYAPYADGTIIKVKSAADATDAPVITYTMPDDFTQALDFVAGQTMNVQKGSYVTTTNSAVNLDLKHQLTRLSFEAKGSIETEAATRIVVKSLDFASANGFTIYKSADYKFNTATTSSTVTDHVQDGVWSNYAGDEDVDFASMLNKDNTVYGTDGTINKQYPAGKGKVVPGNSTDYVSLLTDGQYLFFIPPAKDGLTAAGGALTITYDIITDDAALDGGYAVSSNAATIALPAGILKQGVAYNIQIEISLDEVKLSAGVIEWDSAADSDGTVTDTEGVTTTIPVPVPAP